MLAFGVIFLVGFGKMFWDFRSIWFKCMTWWKVTWTYLGYPIKELLHAIARLILIKVWACSCTFRELRNFKGVVRRLLFLIRWLGAVVDGIWQVGVVVEKIRFTKGVLQALTNDIFFSFVLRCRKGFVWFEGKMLKILFNRKWSTWKEDDKKKSFQ